MRVWWKHIAKIAAKDGLWAQNMVIFSSILHIIYQHLEKRDELIELLVDPTWMINKIESTNVLSLLSDYDFADNNDLSIIQSAIRLSGHVIAGDLSQFRGQLYSRLMYTKSELIKNFLESIKGCESNPSLRYGEPESCFTRRKFSRYP